MKLKMGAFASHGGTNLQAIMDACDDQTINGEVGVVISNNSRSKALERAKKQGISAYHCSLKSHPNQQALDEALLSLLEKHEVNIILLCGYMKKISPSIVERYPGKILNIHPALLPNYGGKGMYGLHVHEAVLKAGEKHTGATVHVVDHRYDQGRILMQKKVQVKPDDTPETLQQRVLKIEHQLYVEVLSKISHDELILT